VLSVDVNTHAPAPHAQVSGGPFRPTTLHQELVRSPIEPLMLGSSRLFRSNAAVGASPGEHGPAGPQPSTAVANVNNGSRHIGVSLLVDAHGRSARQAEDLGNARGVDEIVCVDLWRHVGSLAQIRARLPSFIAGAVEV
jgi:hypothetical protein